MRAFFCFSTARHLSVTRGQQLRLPIRWGHPHQHQGAGQKKFRFYPQPDSLFPDVGIDYDAARSDGSYGFFGHSDQLLNYLSIFVTILLSQRTYALQQVGKSRPPGSDGLRDDYRLAEPAQRGLFPLTSVIISMGIFFGGMAQILPVFLSSRKATPSA